MNSHRFDFGVSDVDFPDVNRVVVAGDLLYDPPLRRTKKGVPVTNFVITTHPDYEIIEPEELRTKKCYVSVVVWAQKAIYCSDNLRKGSPVLIIGELQSMPNFAPEMGYYPVQVNATWIQVLEKAGSRNKDLEKRDSNVKNNTIKNGLTHKIDLPEDSNADQGVDSGAQSSNDQVTDEDVV